MRELDAVHRFGSSVLYSIYEALSPDTSPEVERIMIEGYRKMPAWKKLQQVLEVTQLVQQLVMNDIRRRYPLADDHERKLRLASRWLGPELMKKAFAWDPEDDAGVTPTSAK